MTEQEAKTKRCIGPADCGRLVEISKRMTNAGDTLTARIRVCIGSTCMGWRWDRDGWSLRFDENGPVLARQTTESHGFCGIAGRP